MHQNNAVILERPFATERGQARAQPTSAESSGGQARLGVLLIVESCAGGTGRHVLDLAEGLIARGCEVHLIYSTGRIDRMFLERLPRIEELRHVSLKMRTGVHPNDASAVWKIRRYMKSAGPFDIVHGHSSKGGALARLAAFWTGARVIYTLHGLIMMDPLLARWKSLMYLSIEWGLRLRTEKIIAVSPEEARAAKKLGLGDSRVITIPNGIGEPSHVSRAHARKIMGLENEALVVGFVGRLVTQKAPEVLVRAFAELCAAQPRARLAMIGAGPLMDSLCALSRELGVAEKIVWLGERPAAELLPGFDLFALASRKEGLPYVILEAMAVGLPIVAMTSAGVEILIEEGVNGHAVAPEDPAAFGAALIDICGDQRRMSAFGQASRQRAALFTIDAMVDRTLDAYRSVAREAAKP